MGIQDLIITPIYLLIFLGLAFVFRNKFSTPQTRKYFIPALAVRFFGAIMLGVIYQFYYGGGDTFNYWTHGSRWIWEAFMNDPSDGLRLLTKTGTERSPDLYEYSQHIWYYRDPASYFIIRLTTIFDLFTYHTYSTTALFFALINFSGMWAFFSAVQKKYPQYTKWLGIGILFFPSLVFWGSGILKDTITLAAVGWMTWALLHWFEFNKKSLKVISIFIFGTWILFSIKIYILICFLPAVAIWLFLTRIGRIRNPVLKILIAPLLLFIFGLSAYLSMVQITFDNEKYAFDKIAERARITAYDIRYGWGARTGGDGGYDLGELDGTWQSMIKLAPSAINVSLFRPYLWEAKNSLMLMAALESSLIGILTIWVFAFRSGFKKILSDPFLVFCALFVLLFAFAVGVSTYNFGTLMRYKIPILPFYLILLFSSALSKNRVRGVN